MRLALCLLTVLMTAAAWPAAATPVTDAQAETVLLSKHRVDIGGGRRMNLVCIGHGGPTIVFDYGLGGHMLNWQKIAAGAANISRVCFYDRAGYGFSDPSKRPMTAMNVTSDLHALLHRAGVRGRVVLVGHSLGGLYATLYTDRYWHEVAGLVLIDPAFAGDGVPLTPDEQAKMRKDHADDHAHTDGCVALARKGALSMSDPHDCYAPAPGRTPGERAYLAYQFDRPGRYEAVQSEADSVFGVAPGDDEDSRKERKLAHRFGDMPITVLTASNPLEGSAAPAADHKVAFEAQWKAGHDALANRSVRGVSDVVPGAGHNIQLDQPQAVLDAIADVVARSRAKMEP